ncbi:hypothetical protein GGI20_004681 [Coemansia sp. BCRC 34301]|nr:hypothetical protein GGI20_004681 [Coemansia sp. BCRC 34301]
MDNESEDDVLPTYEETQSTIRQHYTLETTADTVNLVDTPTDTVYLTKRSCEFFQSTRHIWTCRRTDAAGTELVFTQETSQPPRAIEDDMSIDTLRDNKAALFVSDPPAYQENDSRMEIRLVLSQDPVFAYDFVWESVDLRWQQSVEAKRADEMRLACVERSSGRVLAEITPGVFTVNSGEAESGRHEFLAVSGMSVYEEYSNIY